MAAEPNAPTPLQTLFLWALVGRGGEAPQKDLKPRLEKPDRAALVRLGLLAEGRGPRRSVRFEVTDRGWAWAAANTAAKLPDRGTAALPVLTDLLATLGRYLAAREVSLADFVRPGPTPPQSASPEPAPNAAKADPASRIRAAYLAATGQAIGRRARLADIRQALSDLSRAVQDQALRELVVAGGAGLLPFDDPAEITDTDRAAALVVGDQARHMLWLDR